MGIFDSLEQAGRWSGATGAAEAVLGIREDRKAAEIRQAGIDTAKKEGAAGDKAGTDVLDQTLARIEASQKQYTDYITTLNASYKGVGDDAIARLNAFLKDPSMVQLLPGYKEGLAEAESGLSRRMSATGETLGAATAAEFGLQSQDYQRTKTSEFLNDIKSLIGVGQTAVGNMSNAATASAGTMANAHQAAGSGKAGIHVNAGDRNAGFAQDRAEVAAGIHDIRANVQRDNTKFAMEMGPQLLATAGKVAAG